MSLIAERGELEMFIDVSDQLHITAFMSMTEGAGGLCEEGTAGGVSGGGENTF